MKNFLIPLAVLILIDPALSQVRTNELMDITREEVEIASLDSVGKNLLDDPAFKWQHGQTPHFVIHYERKIFAAKVARQAEYFYDFIGQDLVSATDRTTNRSHIFIFRDEKDWKYFIQSNEIAMEWAFAFVNGMTMYLQQAENAGSSAGVLGHEMTHLVFNRYYTGRLPVWLNEGTAEWYGEFAYSAFKGVKKSKRQVFRRISTVFPIPQLVVMTAYPADQQAIHSFYETSKFLVGYLQLNYPPEKFGTFISDMAGGSGLELALQKNYGINSIVDLESAFRKFIR
jgi:hypothetical protein